MTINQTLNRNFPDALPCYTPAQIEQLENNWFTKSDSFGLMQQASWQIATWLKAKFCPTQLSVLVVVGNGNNGGDGWGIAGFLTQLCPNWQVQVLEVAAPTTLNSQRSKGVHNLPAISLDAFLALQKNSVVLHFDMIIDGIFGIGLNKQPTGDFANMIQWINAYKQRFAHCQIISIDVPSGLNATTGEVYRQTAVKADITLCLIARKIGLHLYHSKDYVGQIVDLPLIPVPNETAFYYHTQIPTLPKRPNVSHKGNYGHVLIIGGNRLANGQGMAGASLLSAACAFAVGAGKVTVACHTEFHSAIISRLPNAMTADLHQQEAVCELIKAVDVVAIGMGLGRDKASFNLFKTYLNAILDGQKTAIIDADGLYHLANLPKTLIDKLKKSETKLYFTPHSGEASRLLDCDFKEIDDDKLAALQYLFKKFGTNWLIKGAQTVVLENNHLHGCGLGNAGMATAGMGDCLAGVVAGLLAQQEVLDIDYPLLAATLIHAKAGDNLAKQIGEYALSADMMADEIERVCHEQTKPAP